MARKYYKRRYYRRKGRWSANIKTITDDQFESPAHSSFFHGYTLCENPVQTDATVSQQYTVKNIELSYEIETPRTNNVASGSSYIEGLIAYVMFVPQGMTVTEIYPNTHPEYIMAYKFLGSPNVETTGNNDTVSPGRNPLKIKTRMARRLQTGDSVILLLVGTNNSSSATNLSMSGIVRWWTKAN